MGTVFRKLDFEEINTELFSSFIRKQTVTDCRRKINGQWVVKSDPFTDDWGDKEYIFLVCCLKNTVKTGGFVYGAFIDGKLKGFTSVESTLFGTEKQYADLTSIHVSADMRGKGIGKNLFEAAKVFAKKAGAKKLYISAHSAVETQAFYKAMGCVEAEEYSPAHTEKEPFDCQLECNLTNT